MCIACEMGFWDMVEALPPETREQVLREEIARRDAVFACDAPQEVFRATPPEIQEDNKP
jgi:hypothetical protein